MSIKANIIIQCRFSSSRLPGKALYPVCGIPLVDFLIKRLKSRLSQDEFEIILATTSNSCDDPVAAWGQYEGIAVVRGSEDDVLSRYIEVLKLYPSSVNVRVTADNPLTCPEIIKKSVHLLKEKGLDYVGVKDFPYGSGVDVFRDRLIYLSDKEGHSKEDREHINNYLLNNPKKFNREDIEAHGELKRPGLRVTIDTMEDYNNVSLALKKISSEKPWEISLKEVIKFFKI